MFFNIFYLTALLPILHLSNCLILKKFGLKPPMRVSQELEILSNDKAYMSLLFMSLASSAFSSTTLEEREFGHWLVLKSADDSDPNVVSCSVQNVPWIPATRLLAEVYIDWNIRFYVNKRALTSAGTIDNGKIADFSEWDKAGEQWVFSSNLYDDGKTSKYEQQNVVAKVDGKMIDLLAPNLIEELKGKVELTYRYTAFNLPNMPINQHRFTYRFTQAWNYASEICR